MRPDHPRIRGEHLVTRDQTLVVGGSSPHTRGARWSWSVRRAGDGIIPAYAGSTAGSFFWRRTWSDHPRIRGEHVAEIEGEGSLVGSSPHTRGAPSGANLLGSPVRIIPAYAGSTGRAGRSTSRSSDHPRIRGEHLAAAGPDGPGERIIPAYAGSTGAARG